MEEQKEVKEVKIDKNKKRESRKFILYILIIILIVSLVALIYRIGSARKESNDKKNNFISNFFETINSQIDNINDEDKTINKSMFNSDFEFYSGTISDSRVGRLLDEVITNNKKNKDLLIEVVLETESYGTDTTKILTIKSLLESNKDYEVILDYNDNGYVNKVTLMKSTKIDQFEIDSFNNVLEMYEGTKMGHSVIVFLDEVISSNKTEKDHLIEVVFMGTSYGTDSESIRNIKNSIDKWSNYEISLEYDSVGFVNKATIFK